MMMVVVVMMLTESSRALCRYWRVTQSSKEKTNTQKGIHWIHHCERVHSAIAFETLQSREVLSCRLKTDLG